jgi:hypothetical protein
MLQGAMSREAVGEVLAAAAAGRLKVLYLAPEKLGAGGVLAVRGAGGREGRQGGELRKGEGGGVLAVSCWGGVEGGRVVGGGGGGGREKRAAT